MNQFLSLVALMAALMPLSASAAPPPATQDVASRVDNYMRGRMPNLRTPGVSLVVVAGDQVILSRGYGFASLDSRTPMTPDTPIGVASNTKGLTALALMQLVEQGLVELDAPVVSYVPEFSMDDVRAQDITVRQLLSHTAGIPQSFGADGAQDEQALERHVAALSSVKLHAAPGAAYEYANDGYSIAGLVVQKVSGMPYEDYLSTHVLVPLGMQRTTFDPTVAAELGLADGYTKRSGVVTSGPVPFSRGYGPAGMLITTANDVGRYFVMLLNGGAVDGSPIISSGSLDQMWTAQPATGQNEYGLGWGIHTEDGVHFVYHGGDLAIPSQTSGSSGSQFLLAPAQRIAVGVLANMSSAEKSEIAQDTLSIILGGEPAARPTPPDWRHTTFTADRSVWSRYVGEYTTAQGALRVYRQSEKLFGFAAGTEVEFVPMSDTQFVILCDQGSCDEVPVEFRVQPDGSVIFLWQGEPYGRKQV